MLYQNQLHCLLLMAQLLLLPMLHASPVSSPEIANKSAKSLNSVLAQHNQQQQQQQLKSNSNGQDAHLNSLNAFASGYDSLSQSQAQGQGQVQPTEMGFKPSYKMPEMETNFTPMQNGGINVGLGDSPNMANLPSTPMLMQYLPAQTLQDGSGTVQYLQLIPTRPIIVPISPYLAAAANAGLQAQAPVPASASAPALTPSVAVAPDYGARGSAVQLSGLPPNTAVTGLHYAHPGLQGYTSAIAPLPAYRSSYRINREAKDKHFPSAFSLNLNEYLPGPSGGHDASHSHHPQMYIRARA